MEFDGVPTVLDDRAETERVDRLLRLLSELYRAREECAVTMAADPESMTKVEPPSDAVPDRQRHP